MKDLRLHVCIVVILLWSSGDASAFQNSKLRTVFFDAAVTGRDDILIFQPLLSSSLTQRFDVKTKRWANTIAKRKRSVIHQSSPNTSEKEDMPPSLESSSTPSAAVFVTVSVAYWYFLVFGAAAHENGLWVPNIIPLVPGWPPSDADLAPAIEDSVHFFYISDALAALSRGGDVGSQTIPSPPPLRLAFFNLAEAWVFAFLPVLLKDKKKLPTPIVVATWIGALGLTNAFLMPYLAFRELLSDGGCDDDNDGDRVEIVGIKNILLTKSFGIIASIVVGWASFEVVSMSTLERWTEFGDLVVTDRTYLAFAIDLIIFGITQKFLLNQVAKAKNPIYGVPFAGLIAWLLDE